MEKISDKLLNLNVVSKKILKYGLLVVLISFIIANILVRNADSVRTMDIAYEFALNSGYAFCEVIIGAIMLDVLVEKEDKKNDQ